LTSNVPGIVAVAPLLIGLVSAVRDPPPPRSELIESVVALVALAALSGLIIFLPRDPWAIVALVALLPIAAMACSSLQAGFRGGSRIHRCPYNRLDDNIQHRYVR
jgi:hypothetical protein